MTERKRLAYLEVLSAEFHLRFKVDLTQHWARKVNDFLWDVYWDFCQSFESSTIIFLVTPSLTMADTRERPKTQWKCLPSVFPHPTFSIFFLLRKPRWWFTSPILSFCLLLLHFLCLIYPTHFQLFSRQLYRCLMTYRNNMDCLIVYCWT